MHQSSRIRLVGSSPSFALVSNRTPSTAGSSSLTRFFFSYYRQLLSNPKNDMSQASALHASPPDMNPCMWNPMFSPVTHQTIDPKFQDRGGAVSPTLPTTEPSYQSNLCFFVYELAFTLLIYATAPEGEPISYLAALQPLNSCSFLP